MPKYYYKLTSFINSSDLIIVNKQGNKVVYNGITSFVFNAPERSKYCKNIHRIKNDVVLSMIGNDRYKSNREIFNMLVKEDFKRLMYAKHSIIIKYER